MSGWSVSKLEIMRNMFSCEMTKVGSDVVE